eukprot:1976251-Amphidinium_carterae.2
MQPRTPQRVQCEVDQFGHKRNWRPNDAQITHDISTQAFTADLALHGLVLTQCHCATSEAR